MGLFSFIKGSGKELEDNEQSVDDKVAQMQADHRFAQALQGQLEGLGLGVEGLAVRFTDGRATLVGKVASADIREKLVVAAGNTVGVETVEALLTVAEGESAAGDQATEEAEMAADLYTVQAGDTLGKIAKEYYGDAMKYPEIFEANKPMLESPDLIYPGQVLRIPKLEG